MIVICKYIILICNLHQLLDYLLGKEHVALFRRAELKTLVNLHGNEVCMMNDDTNLHIVCSL